MEIKVCLSVLYIENIAQDHIPVLWESVHRCFGYQDCPVFLPDLGTVALSPFFKGRNRKGERACNHFFYDPLPPTFGVFEIKRISALKHLTCHWVGIFFKFLTWLFRAGLIPSECKKGVGRQHVRTLSILVDLTISEPRTGWFLACSCVLIFSVIWPQHNKYSWDSARRGGSHVPRLNFKTPRVGVYKCLLLIVGFAVTVAIWPREVFSCHDFILCGVATLWAMLLVGIYPGRTSFLKYSSCAWFLELQ